MAKFSERRRYVSCVIQPSSSTLSEYDSRPPLARYIIYLVPSLFLLFWDPVRPRSFRSFYFLGLSYYSREQMYQMYQALPALPYCKRQKAWRGTGNEATCTHVHYTHTPTARCLLLPPPTWGCLDPGPWCGFCCPLGSKHRLSLVLHESSVNDVDGIDAVHLGQDFTHSGHSATQWKRLGEIHKQCNTPHTCTAETNLRLWKRQVYLYEGDILDKVSSLMVTYLIEVKQLLCRAGHELETRLKLTQA